MVLVVGSWGGCFGGNDFVLKVLGGKRVSGKGFFCFFEGWGWGMFLEVLV